MTQAQGEQAVPLSRLLNFVSHEFAGACHVTPLAANRAVFQTKTSAMQFEVVEKVNQRLLSRTEECEFQLRVPARVETTVTIYLNHTGRFSRTGIQATVKRGGATAQALADHLLLDAAFVTAMLPLDCKYFHLTGDANGWLVQTGQMGAAWLAMRVPPMKRYIPMGKEQVQTLVQTLQRLDALLRQTTG